MKEESSNSFGGILLPLLGVLFIALKLTGYVTWSWLWVLAPLWGPAALLIVVIVFYVGALIAIELLGGRE